MLEQLVQAAIARFQPELAEHAAAARAEGRFVAVDFPWAEVSKAPSDSFEKSMARLIIACAMENRSSTVMMRPLTKTTSSGAACAARYVAPATRTPATRAARFHR